MRYKTKLMIGFGSLLFLMFVLLAILSNILARMSGNINEIVDDRYEKLKLANQVQNQVNMMNGLLMDIVLDDREESMREDKESFLRAVSDVTGSLEILQRDTDLETGKKLVEKTSIVFHTYEKEARNAVEIVEAGHKAEAARVIRQEINQIRNDLLQTIDDMKNYQEKRLDEAYSRAMDQFAFLRDINTYFIFIGLAVGILVSIWVIRSIGKSLKRITSVITTASLGSTEQLPRIPIHTRDHIGDIARAFNEMAESLEIHAHQEKEYKQAINEHSWLKTQIAEITACCQGIQDVHALAGLLVQKITPLVGAQFATFYIRESHADTLRLVRAGTYGFDPETSAKHIGFGEGLIGQAALQNHPIHLAQLPDNYIKVKSGLGSAKPSILTILPIDYEEQVLGVLEIASFHSFTPLQQNLLGEIAGYIGPIMNSIFKHMQVRDLLKESQTLTEELQSQSEELQLQQEELRSINEKLEEQYKNSETKAKELGKVKEELEANAHHLQMASQYKSEFLANMSHELRTPLNSLLILAQILSENKEKNLTDRQMEYASTIYTSGHNLLNLINDILDLTKVESGKMEIVLDEVPIREVVASIERSFRPVALDKGLEFTVHIADNFPQNLFTDEQRLEQILTNLLSNSFKFTAQGSVHLMIGVEGSDHGHTAVFAIKDTGIGIQKEKQEVIFEAFKQADGTTSRKFGGTGLGLSISRELANLLGGSIRVESREDSGSIFTLSLPIAQEKQAVPEPYFSQEAATAVLEPALDVRETAEGEGLQGKKVLVVDDDMRNIFALTAALEERQMTVIFAENGREGVQVLEENPDIDIILMDIMMPEMDGYEAIEKIRSMPDCQRLPILALTAKAMKHDREKCIEAGASDYISKPVNMEQLMSLMRVWLYS